MVSSTHMEWKRSFLTSNTYWEKFPLLMHTMGAFLEVLDLETALTG
jgi:hypothetical protein